MIGGQVVFYTPFCEEGTLSFVEDVSPWIVIGQDEFTHPSINKLIVSTVAHDPEFTLAVPGLVGDGCASFVIPIDAQIKPLPCCAKIGKHTVLAERRLVVDQVLSAPSPVFWKAALNSVLAPDPN